MANERLRRAIQQAGLRLEDVADHVEIDVKTAERWITKGRLPHARNRARTAQLLGVDELELWPELADERTGRASTDGELVRLYAHRGAVPHERWYELLEATTRAARRAGASPGCSCRMAARISPRWSGGRPRRASRFGCCTAIPRAMRSRCAAPRRASATGWPRGSGWRSAYMRDAFDEPGVVGAAARHDALQLDLPLRRRAAREHARVRRRGRAVAGPAPAAASRAGGCSITTWRASSASGRRPGRSRGAAGEAAWRGVAVGRRIDYLDDPDAPAANSLVPSVNVAVVDDRGSAAADPALGQRQLGVARWRDGPGRDRSREAASARRKRRPASTARSPAWSASTRTRGT